jgi:hypothetical protein
MGVWGVFYRTGQNQGIGYGMSTIQNLIDWSYSSCYEPFLQFSILKRPGYISLFVLTILIFSSFQRESGRYPENPTVSDMNGKPSDSEDFIFHLILFLEYRDDR